jgi:hypothetical protein
MKDIHVEVEELFRVLNFFFDYSTIQLLNLQFEYSAIRLFEF